MTVDGTITAFRTILSKDRSHDPLSYEEDFAVRRFRKKFECPDASKKDELSALAWAQFIDFDGALPKKLVLPHSLWYKARQNIHKMLANFHMGDLVITNGSEFSPTQGYNSIEQKLMRSRWETTRGNLDLFTDLVIRNRSLMYSLRRRFNRRVERKGLCPRLASKYLWRECYHPDRQVHFRRVIKAKITFVSRFVEGSRFSTVYKNNEKRRPINLETLLNMLTQRCIGNGLREVLRLCGLDLDTLADKHRVMIADPTKATIDLKNASDSVSMALVRFLFPAWFVELVEQARSPALLGPDGDFHMLNKVSSMGNGFTFELMSLILYAVGSALDPQFSVFGDDIIISNDKAPELIQALESVGFVINKDKSFVNSKFRESCGANYHDDYGYLESYDFLWPESIGDCVGIYNKAKRLSRFGFFSRLERELYRVVPKAWRGPVEPTSDVGPLSRDFPSHFATGGNTGVKPKGLAAVAKLARLYLHEDVTERDIFVSWRFESEEATPLREHLKLRFHWGKYFMYLFGGRRTRDVLRDTGVWVSFLSVGDSVSNTSWTSYRRALMSEEQNGTGAG